MRSSGKRPFLHALVNLRSYALENHHFIRTHFPRPCCTFSDAAVIILCRALMNLATEENTHVFLLSSERRDLLMRWLGDTQGLENIGLAAEDGYLHPSEPHAMNPHPSAQNPQPPTLNPKP